MSVTEKDKEIAHNVFIAIMGRGDSTDRIAIEIARIRKMYYQEERYKCADRVRRRMSPHMAYAIAQKVAVEAILDNSGEDGE
jgi:hypothetical protein